MRLSYLCLPLLLSLEAYTQSSSFHLGARSAAMATAAVSNDGFWTVFGNVAGMTGVEKPCLGIGHQMRYSLKSLSSFGAAYVHPFHFGQIGVAAYRFGDRLFNEQKLGISYSDRIGIVALGLTVNYLQIRIEGLGQRNIFPIEMGGLVQLHEQVVVGAHITNINQTMSGTAEGERLPTIMKLGFSYQPSDVVKLNVEVEKAIDFSEVFKSGLEYNFLRKFYARTGFRTGPFTGTFGLGLVTKRINVDYSFGRVSPLGDQHEISMVYRMGEL